MKNLEEKMDEKNLEQEKIQLEAELANEKRKSDYEARKSQLQNEVARNEIANLKGWIALILFCVIVIALGL